MTMTDSKEIIKRIKEKKRFKSLRITTGNDPDLIIKKIPFDILSLDELLGEGIPIGKYTLVYGTFSVGKTFLLQKIISSAQKRGISLVYIDVDKSYEPDWWKVVGVDVDNLWVAQPMYGEQVFDLALSLVKEKMGLIVIDSLDLIVPKVEAETDIEDGTMNLSLQRAKLISKSLRMIKNVNTGTAVIYANHINEGIGGPYSQWSIPGGRAQSDFASVMMWISRGSHIKENEVKKGGDDKKRVGFNMKVTLEKDKICGRRYDSCQLPFIFEGGVIDNVAGLMEICIDLGIISKDRGSYEFLGQKIFGKRNVKECLMSNENIQEELRNLVREKKDK